MMTQLLFALALTCATVIIHAAGTVRAVMPLSGIWRKDDQHPQSPVVVLPIIRLVSALLLLHILEMSLWAVAYFGMGIFADFETSLYYSLTSYTTVGYGDIIPPTPWRLVGPIQAAVGVLMLGVSTGIIVAAVQRIYHRLNPDEKF